MKKLFIAGVTAALLLVFLIIATAAFQVGRSAGFKTGSEWALFQAELVAREAGMSLPVYLRDGVFRVVMKQPPGLYRKAWRLADKHDGTENMIQTAKRERVSEKRGLPTESPEVKNNP